MEFSFGVPLVTRRCRLPRNSIVLVVGIFVLVILQFDYDQINVIRPSLSSFGGGGGEISLDHRQETTKGVIPKTADRRYAVCSKFSSPSTASVWKELKNQTLLGSHYPGALGQDKAFQGWIDQLFSFYTPERLRRSISSRASTSAVRRILQILSDYPETNVPLHILVSGGSVTSGYNCGETPPGIPGGAINTDIKNCAWPARLEYLWNHMLFGGEEVVQVTSIAAGGTASDVATIALEYQLFPKDRPPPHIVLLSHSTNDVQHANIDNELLYKHMQDTVQASHKIRLCDPDLPLVILVDDFYGGVPLSWAIEQTSRFHAIASWYNLMSISYGNTIRHEIISRFIDGKEYLDPLVGSSNVNMHLGMGFHIGVGLTVMYNFLNAIVDACYADPNDGLETSEVAADWWPNETGGILELGQMKSRGAPSKYIGYLERESQASSVTRQWKEQVREKERRCKGGNISSSLRSVEPLCEYAWMSYRSAGIEVPADIDRVLSDVLTHADGWHATGNKIKQPRTGWYANKQSARFSLKIPVKTVETHFFTVLIMQSYGPNFVGTNLVMDVRVQSASPGIQDAQASYEVSGYHEIKTSVHVPHKYRIPRDGAKVNDTIIIDFTLAAGSYFKIAGLAFCSH